MRTQPAKTEGKTLAQGEEEIYNAQCRRVMSKGEPEMRARCCWAGVGKLFQKRAT